MTTNDNLIANSPIIYEKPIIKWIGGKTQIIDKIIENFPKSINDYHELFLGGGSVLLALLQNIKHNKINLTGTINAYDVNNTLIYLYKNIQNKPNEIIIEIKKIMEIYQNIKLTSNNKKPKTELEALTSQESYYYWIRLQFNQLSQEQKNLPIGSAYFIFLNKTCFRGMYREGPNGFNVPFGNYKNPEIINEEHIIRVSNLIKDVNFYCMSFEQSFEEINKIKDNDNNNNLLKDNDNNNNIIKKTFKNFLYLDPPYAPINSKSFVNYTSLGFNLDQHNLLFTLCKNHNFLMSNADVDLVKNSFNDNKFLIQTILCKRSINSKNPESKVNEVLIKSI